MDKKRLKKAKHNHSQNLETVLKELRQYSEQGGVSLAYLALTCGVSTRQIYRYLNELQSLGYEIVKVVGHESEYSGGYILKNTELEEQSQLPLLSMLEDLEKYKHQIFYAKVFIKELLVRTWMNKLGLILPLHFPVLALAYDDAITVSRQTQVFSSSEDGAAEDVKLRVSAKTIHSIYEHFSGEIVAKQKQKDGWFYVHLKTKRSKEMTGVLPQWGSEIEVVEPGWLRHKILENCKAILHANRLRKLDKTDLYSTAGKYLVSY